MAIIVSFVTAKGVGSIDNLAINDSRVRESLAIGGTTTATTAQDELTFILNTEASAVFVAFGTAPDAALTTKNNTSSAGVPVPSGGSIALNPPRGSKINAKAAS